MKMNMKLSKAFNSFVHLINFYITLFIAKIVCYKIISLLRPKFF